MSAADPTDLRGRLLAERAAILQELAVGEALPPGLLCRLSGVQLAIQALADDRGGEQGSKFGPMTAVSVPPLHEVLAGIANELEAWATGRAPKPQDLHVLSERVEQIAERVLQGGVA